MENKKTSVRGDRERKEKNLQRKTATTGRSSGSSGNSRTAASLSQNKAGAGKGASASRKLGKQTAESSKMPVPAKRKDEKPQQDDNRPRSEAFIHQFIPFILIIVAIFITACFVCYGIEPSAANALGPVGYGLCFALYGVFGVGAFCIPVIAVGLAIFWRKLIDNGKLLLKFLLCLLTMILFSAVVHVFAVGGGSADVGFLFGEGVKLHGGGIMGGAIGYVMAVSVHLLGTILIGIPAIMALIMIITEITPVRIAKLCREKYTASREKARARKANKPKREKEPISTRKPEPDKKKHAQARNYGYDADDTDADYDAENVGKEKKKTSARADGYDDDGIRVVTGRDGIYEDIRGNAERIKENASDYINEIDTYGSENATPAYDRSDADAASIKAKKDKEKRRRQEKFLTDDVAYTGASDEIADDDYTDSEKDMTVDTVIHDSTESGQSEQNADGEETESYYEDADEIFPRSTLSPVRRSRSDSGNVFDCAECDNGDDGAQNGGDYSADEENDEELTADITDSETENSENPTEYDEPPKPEYKFPPIELMSANTSHDEGNVAGFERNKLKLKEVLESFRIRVKDITYSHGPTITRYEVVPESGVRVRSIANLVDDIALGLACSGVRIEAPIPGKAAVGIEVPNETSSTVYLRGLIESPRFSAAKSKLNVCLGEDVTGKPMYFDIEKMPHLLIAGATGMGKSVCINSIIVSLLYKAKPDEVKLIMIDPKKVEFSIYKDIPHLYCPIVSDPKKAAGALASAVGEMERRFELIEEVGVRDIAHYNMMIENDPDRERMPQMVIIIDELADLMMTAPDDVETAICRLTQKARAAGIHLIIGTQRPSVDVITGLIKSNIPSRIAFTVASQVDSRTIIDIAGAEKLIGRGDMLYAPVGAPKPIRVQGAFISESEVERIVEFIKENNNGAVYNEEFAKNIDIEAAKCGTKKGASGSTALDGRDEDISNGDPKLQAAIDIAIETGKIATSLLQRRLEIGYGRAAKIIDQMEEMGIVSAAEGNKPRRVLVTRQDMIERRISSDDSASDDDMSDNM